MAIFRPKTIHLQGRGAKKVLGEVEAEILEILWSLEAGTVRQVRDRLAKAGRDLSFNAVMTIMNRLVEKRLLTKCQEEQTFCYTPTVNRQDFSRRIAKDILSAVLRDTSLLSAAGLGNLGEKLDRKTLEKLRKIIS